MYLAIESSQPNASLALFDRSGVLAELGLASETPARDIAALIETLLHREGLTVADLRALAVSVGPGSYTGARVAVTTAKALAYARRLPVLAESSLAILAQGALDGAEVRAGDRLRTVLDARRGAVFTAEFAVDADADGRLVLRRLEPDRVLDVASLAAQAGPSRVLGPGASLLLDRVEQAPPVAGARVEEVERRGTFERVSLEFDVPRASALAALVRGRIDAASFDAESLHALAPRYLQASRPELLRAEAAAARGEREEA